MPPGWGAATNAGLVRDLNEDCLLARPPVFVVADGMGGHAAGDVASQLAVDEFKQFAEADTGALGITDVLAVLDRANAAILAESERDATRVGMGTTIAGVISVMAGGSDHWLVFNVGDSRVYRIAEGRMEQITTDHSEAQELISSGELTPETARTYHRRHVVTRSLGTDPAPVPDSWLLPVQSSERFVVCSDGLTLELSDLEISERALCVVDPQELAEDLVNRALAMGGHDNITVLVIDGQPATESADVDEDTLPKPCQGGTG